MAPAFHLPRATETNHGLAVGLPLNPFPAVDLPLNPFPAVGLPLLSCLAVNPTAPFPFFLTFILPLTNDP